MSDNKDIRHPHDGKRIDVNDRHEIRNWTKSFAVTEKELKAAVSAVGTSSEAVRKKLGK